MKKFLIVTIFSFIITSNVFASNYKDIDSSFAKNEIVEFENQGYFNVFDFGDNFTPKEKISRGEAIVLIVNSNNIEKIEEGKTPFLDFESINDKYKPYVISSYVNGITKGVKEADGVYFNYDELVTREQFVTLLGNYYGVSSDLNATFLDKENISNWAISYVNFFYEKGLVLGDEKGYFNPKSNISREEAVLILDRCKDFFYQNSYIVSQYIGNGKMGYKNSTFTNSTLTIVNDIKFDKNNNIIFSDALSNKLRIGSNGVVSDLVGNENETDFSGLPLGGYVDGAIGEALLKSPEKLLVLENGITLFTEEESNSIRAFDSIDEKVYTLTGKVDSGYKNGILSNALFNKPMGLAKDSKGNIYVADTLNHIIRKIDVEGNVSLFAGIPETRGNSVGTLLESTFNEPVDIFITSNDVMYIADSGNNSIKKIENNIVTLVAGGVTDINTDTETQIGGDVDGSYDTALFSYPMGIYVVGSDIYVADTQNNKIKVISNNLVRTIAGTGEKGNSLGGLDKATFNMPTSILVYDNNIYVADSENSMIKQISLESDN